MENENYLSSAPGVDLSVLSATQREGSTCVRCGRVPLEQGDVTQGSAPVLITCAKEDAATCSRRVFWLTQPCPRWCNGQHQDRDAGPDRRHFSTWEAQVSLILEDGQEMGAGLGWQPEYVAVTSTRVHARMRRRSGAVKALPTRAGI